MSKGDFAQELKILQHSRKDMLRMKRDKGVYSFNMWVERPGKEVQTRNRFEALSVEHHDDAVEPRDFTGPGVDWM